MPFVRVSSGIYIIYSLMSNPAPSVSIIMPVYNAGRFLDQSIGSALGQTCGDFELICFNDASTDNSLEILRRYEQLDPRIRVIDSPVNVKQGAGRNAAIRQATGKYILFLDADDLLVTDAVATCLEAARANDSEIVFFNYATFQASPDNRTDVCRLGADAASLRDDELRLRVATRTSSICASLYARRLFFDNELFFPEKVFYEDNAIALALQLSAANPVMLNRTLYLYRFDNVSTSRANNDFRFFDRIPNAVTLLNHTRRLGLHERFAEAIDYVFINQYFVETIFGAIYRFDNVALDRIAQVRKGIREHLPDYRKNSYYRAQPLRRKLKIETHLRMPRVIKFLSNLNRRLHRVEKSEVEKL